MRLQLTYLLGPCIAVMALLVGCATDARHPLHGRAAAVVEHKIVNAHMHASRIGDDDASYRNTVIAEMAQHGIETTVLHLNEPSDVEDWVQAAPGRFFAGPAFPCVVRNTAGQPMCRWDGGAWPSLDWIRREVARGHVRMLGELLLVYAGVPPTSERMAPYWALAEELDLPVAIHINRGPPPGTPSRPTGCCPEFDPDLGDPALLVPVLERHPGLRLILQHAGFPALPNLGDISYLEATFELLAAYPNLYVDMTALNAVPPAPIHIGAVREFRRRGFIDRLMVGTDNWPAGPIIERYREIDFLTDAELMGVLGDNARRFFRLDEAGSL